MIKKCLYCIGCILLCALSSCEHDPIVVYPQSGGIYEIRMSGVSVKVFPTSLKCGEEITIEGRSTNDTPVSVIISSETLDVNDTLTTPFIWNKTLNRVGNHEITLFVNSAPFPFSTSTTINVR